MWPEVERKKRIEFLYKILKGIGHLECVDVRCRLVINLSLEYVKVRTGCTWLEDGGHWVTVKMMGTWD